MSAAASLGLSVGASSGASATSGSLMKALMGDDKKVEKAKKNAQDFEAVFLTQILNSMSEGLNQDGGGDGSASEGFNGGSAETQWRTLGNEYVARSIASNGGIGIASSVMKELLRAQGA